MFLGLGVALLLIASLVFKGSSEETVVIDPGHGGIDAGTSDKTGLLEKDINLDLGLRLKREFLFEEPKVLMTREKDESLENLSQRDGSRQIKDLDARKNIINENNSTTFVSIHVNSSPNSQTRGIKIYHYPGSTKGKMLADSICQFIDEHVYERYLKEDILKVEILAENFFILRETEMPGVLVEIGFITNPDENKLLKKRRYKRKVAHAIKKGIIEYLEQADG